MTTNDAQIDVLLRRFAGQSQSGPATEHLDADELNAFAEGSLPAASRTRYVSHLADCDDCRKVVSQLAISSGAMVAAEANTAADSAGYSWWKRFSTFFSPLTLRYTAFAAVLIMVVGVGFLVLRQQSQPNFVARNESTNQPSVSAVRPAGPAQPEGVIQPQEKLKGDQTSATPQPETSPVVSKVESKTGETTVQPAAAPPKPDQETLGNTGPALAAKKAPDPVITQSSPSYAPPPPIETDRAETRSREQQNLPGQVAINPRKSEQSNDKSKMMDRSRGGEMSKDVRNEDERNRAVNQPPENIQRAADDKVLSGRDRDALSSTAARNSKESRGQAPAAQSTGGGRRDGTEEAETRSAGGRKFRRQGSGWVDTKFKSSMTLKSIARGSSEFAALDSGLRSIAQQLGSQVIVVWKNKAYVIK